VAIVNARSRNKRIADSKPAYSEYPTSNTGLAWRREGFCPSAIISGLTDTCIKKA
jgi:hypothetical protein